MEKISLTSYCLAASVLSSINLQLILWHFLFNKKRRSPGRPLVSCWRTCLCRCWVTRALRRPYSWPPAPSSTISSTISTISPAPADQPVYPLRCVKDSKVRCRGSESGLDPDSDWIQIQWGPGCSLWRLKASPVAWTYLMLYGGVGIGKSLFFWSKKGEEKIQLYSLFFRSSNSWIRICGSGFN